MAENKVNSLQSMMVFHTRKRQVRISDCQDTGVTPSQLGGHVGLFGLTSDGHLFVACIMGTQEPSDSAKSKQKRRRKMRQVRV